MKKIISMSLYGTKSIYMYNSLLNASLYKNIYPSWELRIYCHKNIPSNHLRQLEQFGCNIIIINDDYESELEGKYSSQLWRFKPIEDKTVDYFVVRDIDSIISDKEYQAVCEWINSGKTFHIMHDNIKHDGCVILGGMWGCKGGLIENIDVEIEKYCKSTARSVKKQAIDQLFLRDVIYKMIGDDYLSHGFCPKNEELFGLKSKEYPPHDKFPYSHLTFIGQVNKNFEFLL